MSADPARVVVDADVLAADLLVGDPARAVVEVLYRHDWLTMVASEPLLAEARAVIADLADDALAADWRGAIESLAALVDHPAGDHPALAAASRGEAAHLVSFEEGLASARTGLAIQPRVSLSIRTPEAFVATFDPASLYEAINDEPYPGPDRPPRA
jgi:predicted nucleic acid-binding protein